MQGTINSKDDELIKVKKQSSHLTVDPIDVNKQLDIELTEIAIKLIGFED